MNCKIQTDFSIHARKPDIVSMNKKKKWISLFEENTLKVKNLNSSGVCQRTNKTC